MAAGARALHVVDLDGARTGEPANLEHIRRIAAAVDVPVQVGGGLRTLDAVRAAAQAGAARVVLGTAALRDVDLLDAAVAELGDRVVVSLDARDGKLAAAGWIAADRYSARIGRSSHLGARGVRRYVYSSIERDGMMGGPDLDGASRVAEVVRGKFVYSGGVASLDDLQALMELRQVNLEGVIVGKAIYEGRLDVGRGAGPARPSSLMHYKRVIPCLDVDAGRVVKGIEFVDLRDAGDPVELAARYDASGRRRARVPRHHRHLGQARHGGRAGPPHRRRGLHPVHDRRRDPVGRRRPGGAATPAPTRSRSIRPPCSAPS